MCESTENPPTPLRKPKRRWLHAFLLGGLILGCGMVIGSGLTLTVLWNGLRQARQHPEQAPDRITKHLQRRLKLDEEQTEAVREIVTRRHRNLEEMRAEIQPRVEAELEEARKEIEAVLTPEQVAKWNRMYQMMQRRLMPPRR